MNYQPLLLLQLLMLLVSLLQQQQEAGFLRATVEKSFLTIPFCSSSVISLLLLRILTHTHIQYTWYTHTYSTHSIHIQYIQYTYTHTTTDPTYFLVPRHF